MSSPRRNRAPWPEAPLFVIDDDLHWLTVIQQALRSLGWHHLRALSQPTFAAQLAGEFQPALVLLDLMMAEKDGRQVLRELRAAQPSLPVIIVSGKDRVEDAVACLQAGAANYLTKPLDRDGLAEAMRSALGLSDPDPQAGDGQAFSDLLETVEELPDLKTVPDLLIEEALRRSGGVIKDAAAMLGISSQAICNRRKRAEQA